MKNVIVGLLVAIIVAVSSNSPVEVGDIQNGNTNTVVVDPVHPDIK